MKNLHLHRPSVSEITGAIFGVFLLFHVINLSTSSFGAKYFDYLMGTFRKVYQRPIVEYSLVAVALLHVIAGLTRIARRLTSEELKNKSFLHRLQPISTKRAHTSTGYFQEITCLIERSERFRKLFPG